MAGSVGEEFDDMKLAASTARDCGLAGFMILLGCSSSYPKMHLALGGQRECT